MLQVVIKLTLGAVVEQESVLKVVAVEYLETRVDPSVDLAACDQLWNENY